MANSHKIHWGRILLGGFLAELLVFAIVFPVRHFFGQQAFLASILIASVAMPFLFAMLVCRGIESRVRAARCTCGSRRRADLHGTGMGPDATGFVQNRTRAQDRGRSSGRSRVFAAETNGGITCDD